MSTVLVQKSLPIAGCHPIYRPGDKVGVWRLVQCQEFYLDQETWSTRPHSVDLRGSPDWLQRIGWLACRSDRETPHWSPWLHDPFVHLRPEYYECRSTRRRARAEQTHRDRLHKPAHTSRTRKRRNSRWPTYVHKPSHADRGWPVTRASNSRIL